MNFDEELEKMEAEQSRANGIKGLLGVAGSVMDQFQSIPSSHQLLYGGKASEPTASKAMAQAAGMIGDPAERKKKAFEYLKNKREMAQAQADDQVMSPEKVAFAEGIVPSLKGKFSNMTNAQFKEYFPLITAKFRADGDLAMAKTVAGQRAQDKADAKAEKAELDKKERTTQFGVARTNDDAKKLKDASELKASFDSKLQEMIDLRKKFGGEAWDREAVNRGKSLANDLLLAYKDLSKLGVMSKTDENILRSIIPADPLQFNSPVAELQGSDPTLNQMTKFKADAERDFQERLKNRLEDYTPVAGDGGGPPKTPQERAQAALERKLRAKQTAGQ